MDQGPGPGIIEQKPNTQSQWEVTPASSTQKSMVLKDVLNGMFRGTNTS